MIVNMDIGSSVPIKPYIKIIKIKENKQPNTCNH